MVAAHHLTALPRTAYGKDEQERSGGWLPSTPRRWPEPLSSVRRDAQWNVRIACEALGRDDADPLDSFVGLGGNSLSSVEFTVQLEERSGRDVPTQWHTLSFREPAERIASWLSRSTPRPASSGASQRPPSGERTGVGQAPRGR